MLVKGEGKDGSVTDKSSCGSSIEIDKSLWRYAEHNHHQVRQQWLPRQRLDKHVFNTVFGKEKLHFNSHFQGSDCLPNTCNVSILGPKLQGRNVLLHCQRLLASVGAACHSENVNRPSHVLLNSGIPYEVAENAIRLSVGRATSKEDVDTIVEELKLAVKEIKLCAAQT
ncbi:selenocysteine lyase-like isoform X1 [Leucoraja erinacea]|uniref:selenocysteine lyase-like isoform X1 n=1 Tax=Leucoraja erinaceus TaxID=7782 RepID=UPI002456D888|nr:selenocysteine lyase-like isoform X1 [Leucoraja erinacea]